MFPEWHHAVPESAYFKVPETLKTFRMYPISRFVYVLHWLATRLIWHWPYLGHIAIDTKCFVYSTCKTRQLRCFLCEICVDISVVHEMLVYWVPRVCSSLRGKRVREVTSWSNSSGQRTVIIFY